MVWGYFAASGPYVIMWHDLKKNVHDWKTSLWLNYNNSAIMKGPKILHSWKKLIASYRKHFIAIVTAEVGPTTYYV